MKLFAEYNQIRYSLHHSMATLPLAAMLFIKKKPSDLFRGHFLVRLRLGQTMIDFAPESFVPPLWLRNPHVQTVGGRLFRHFNDVTYRRVRTDTSDGDFIDMDYVDVAGATWRDLGDDAPILLLLHGLEGDARKGYAIEMYRDAAKAGIRPIGMNFRSCSGEMNRTARFYHMGATDDVHFVVNWLRDQYPDVPLFIVGISLGGNMTLKYLGEHGEQLNGVVTAGAAISPPIIATGRQAINHGVGRLYGYHLLSQLKRKVRIKIDIVKESDADSYAALTAQTLREFDNAITAPMHGFKDADDYYNQSNSIRFLPDIVHPTLIIRSTDDPFFNDDIPHDVIARNPNLYGVFPRYGGHVGFIDGQNNDWAQRQIVRFFNKVLEQNAAPSGERLPDL